MTKYSNYCLNSFTKGNNACAYKCFQEWFKNKNVLFAHIEKANEEPNGVSTDLENTLTNEKLCTIQISEIETIKQILVRTKKDIKWKATPANTRSKLLYRHLDIKKLVLQKLRTYFLGWDKKSKEIVNCLQRLN